MSLRRRIPKVLVFVLILMSVAVLGLGLWVLSVRDRRWAGMVTRVQELKAGLTKPLPRIPLGRPVLPGNAWDDYVGLFGDKPLPPLPKNIDQLLSHPDDIEALITEHAVWIDKIQNGVRRQRAQAPPAGTLFGMSAIVDKYSSVVREAISLCIAKARLRAETGQMREALDLLLDVCLCGRDFSETRLVFPYYAGLETLKRGLKEVETLSSRLDGPALQELEQQLSLLDEYFPDTSGDILDQVLYLGELLIKEDEDDQAYINPQSGESRRHWRYFYSFRLEAADRFSIVDRYAQDALAIRTLPWAEAEPATLKLLRRIEALEQTDLAQTLNTHVDLLPARQTRTYLRMVRMAVHYRRTGEIQIPENAQGELIKTKRLEESLLIYNERAQEEPTEESTGPLSRAALESFLIDVPIRK